MSQQTVLGRLKDGVRRFQAEVHAESAADYHRAATTPQQPHTLIIACADSRVDVEAITSSRPGEVFVTRNIGNMVPGYGEMLGGVSAVIEYAVSALKVQHIVVCGHSDCGAMKALLDPASTDSMPTVKSWLEVWKDRQSGKHRIQTSVNTRITALRPYLHPRYVYWPLLQSDQERADLFIGEYSNMFAGAAMMTTLFFGGWTLPFFGLDQPAESFFVGLLHIVA